MLPAAPTVIDPLVNVTAPTVSDRSIKCNVPVIGKVPNLSPDWMSEENGIWVTDQTILPDLVADYAQNWLEDNIDPQIFDKMKETVNITN